DIRARGGDIRTNCPAIALETDNGRATGIRTGNGTVPCRAVVLTTPLPIAADLLAPHAPADYISRLRSIRFLANVCQVLVLDRSLSNLYWTNVNDAEFPFVGVIEHTNFEPPESYGGRHIVYLSKYLPQGADLWRMGGRELLNFSVPHVQRMFPDFDARWIVEHHVWRAAHAQPLVEVGYAGKIPPVQTPLDNAFLVTMAQVYPEDRGTNYALRDGRRMGERMSGQFAAG
ncbi:MAG: FAD-dependent oxidoreductase, partial [Rhodospirillales bacterium]|nr:FAD-dependent oxidoreductase [Rhodospirillales bacterium]